MILYPYPKEVTFGEGLYGGAAQDLLKIPACYDDSMREEEYEIQITNTGMNLRAKDARAEFRARATLRQVIAEEQIPCMHIHDWPDFPNRGVMLDISRGKVPTLETLFQLVDWLSGLKINQVQLYIEGFSFAYPSFPHVWADKTPITGEEIQKLDQFCKERYMDLVANQNCFGHMAQWLALPEYKHLAECPDGFYYLNYPDRWDPFTLDPTNEEGFKLIQDMFEDLLPNFSSDTVNINCDETLELGMGKSKALCEKVGRETVYRDRILRTYDYLKSKGKKVMFWGDIILHAPHLISTLPKDMIALNWGYDAYTPSEESCICFEKSGIPYYMCCGTNAWNSLVGQQDQMLNNIRNSCLRGKAHGAIGILNTDWGDINHLHYLSASYPGFAYGAAMSWNVSDHQEQDLCAYLNRFVYEDEAGIMADAVMNAGHFHNLERLQEDTNTTYTARTFLLSLDAVWGNEMPAKSEIMMAYRYLECLRDVFDDTRMKCKDAQLILDEYRNALEILKYSCMCQLYKRGDYIGGTKESHLQAMRDAQNIFLPEHERLWMQRNKRSELKRSQDFMTKVR